MTISNYTVLNYTESEEAIVDSRLDDAEAFITQKYVKCAVE